jgi:hypothetical protein
LDHVPDRFTSICFTFTLSRILTALDQSSLSLLDRLYEVTFPSSWKLFVFAVGSKIVVVVHAVPHQMLLLAISGYCPPRYFRGGKVVSSLTDMWAFKILQSFTVPRFKRLKIVVARFEVIGFCDYANLTLPGGPLPVLPEYIFYVKHSLLIFKLLELGELEVFSCFILFIILAHHSFLSGILLFSKAVDFCLDEGSADLLFFRLFVQPLNMKNPLIQIP